MDAYRHGSDVWENWESPSNLPPNGKRNTQIALAVEVVDFNQIKPSSYSPHVYKPTGPKPVPWYVVAEQRYHKKGGCMGVGGVVFQTPKADTPRVSHTSHEADSSNKFPVLG